MTDFEIPHGFATKLGQAGTMILAIVAAVTPFLDGDHTGDTRFFAALATIVGVATIIGRMLQSAALLRDAPSPAQTYEEPDVIDDGPEPRTTYAAPAEADLMKQFPDDAPPSGSGKAGEQA